MRSFKDIEGKEWEIKLPMNQLFAIRDDAEIGVDPVSALAQPDKVKAMFESLSTNSLQSLMLLYRTCAGECERINIDRTQFYNRLNGELLGEAILLWIKEYMTHFPKSVREKTLQQMEAMEAKRKSQEPTLLKQLDDELALLQENSDLTTEIEAATRMNRLKAENERLRSLLNKPLESSNDSADSTDTVAESFTSGSFSNV